MTIDFSFAKVQQRFLVGGLQVHFGRNDHRMNVLRSPKSYQRTPAGATDFAPKGLWVSGVGVPRAGWLGEPGERLQTNGKGRGAQLGGGCVMALSRYYGSLPLVRSDAYNL